MTTTTNDQQNYEKELAMLNEQFSKRYTDEDDEYVEMTKNRSYSPPVIPDWSHKNRSYDDSASAHHNRYRHYSNRLQRGRPHQYDRSHSNDRWSNRNNYDADRSHSNDRWSNRNNYDTDRSHSNDRWSNRNNYDADRRPNRNNYDADRRPNRNNYDADRH
jgi:hypothetical protein